MSTSTDTAPAAAAPAFPVGAAVEIGGDLISPMWQGCRGEVVARMDGWPLPIRVAFRCGDGERVEWFAAHELRRVGDVG